MMWLSRNERIAKDAVNKFVKSFHGRDVMVDDKVVGKVVHAYVADAEVRVSVKIGGSVYDLAYPLP